MPNEASPTGETLQDVLTSLTTGTIAEQPAHEEWGDTIARIQVEGRIAEITDEAFYYFLEVLPPKLMRGNWYAFAEGQEPLKLFWQQKRRYFARQLSWDETWRLCAVTGLPRDYGHR